MLTACERSGAFQTARQTRAKQASELRKTDRRHGSAHVLTISPIAHNGFAEAR